MTEENEKAGKFALICSYLIPIVGIICYFVNRNKVENASSYLWAACAGFLVWRFGFRLLRRCQII